jgi:hypothetical protein
MVEIEYYYRILELRIGASEEEIKQAYKDLVNVWHPDRFSNNPRLQSKASEKLKEINLAYRKLIEYKTNSSERTYQEQVHFSTDEDNTYQDGEIFNTVLGIKKLWEYEIYENITRFALFQNDIIMVSSKKVKDGKHFQTIASHNPKKRRINWERQIVISDESQCEVLISNDQLFYAFDKYFVHTDPTSGKIIFESNLGVPVSGVIIPYRNFILLSTINGNIYFYNSVSRECFKVAFLPEYFGYGVIANDLFYVLGRIDRRFFGKSLESIFTINLMDLKTFKTKPFLRIGKDYSTLYPFDNDLCIAIKGKIKRIGFDSKEKWSYFINRVSSSSWTRFHGRYGECLMVSSGGHLSLVNGDNGQEHWAVQLKKDIESAVLLENGLVIFSTAGGGLMRMFDEEPENWVGLYNPITKDQFIMEKIPDTMRIELQGINSNIIAKYRIGDQEKFVNFSVGK